MDAHCRRPRSLDRTVTLPQWLASSLPTRGLLSKAECEALGVCLPDAFAWPDSGEWVEGEAMEHDKGADSSWVHVGYAVGAPNVLLFELKRQVKAAPAEVVHVVDSLEAAASLVARETRSRDSPHRSWRQEEAGTRGSAATGGCLMCDGLSRCYCEQLARYSRHNARVRREAEEFVSDLLL